MINDRTRNLVVWIVTAVWACNFVAGIIFPEYSPSESINGIFTAIVGGAFAISARSKSNDKKDE